MQTIHEPSEVVQQILGRQKRKPDIEYRLLTFVVQRPINEGLLLYNLMTKELLLLNHEEIESLSDNDELIARWFLVPREQDDRKLCKQIRLSIKMMRSATHSIMNYTIFTTTDCNARCFYCFENGKPRVHMTKDMAHNVAKYIIRKCGGNEVWIGWFGGEPLYNSAVIDIICRDLQQAGVVYRSSMASNGYLFDDNIINKAVSLWNLKNVQITLDGTEDVYNRCKRFIYKNGSAYQRVMGNIDRLAKANINIKIRLNIDKHNFSDMEALIGLLASKYAHCEYVKVYVKALYDSVPSHGKRTEVERKEVVDKVIELENRLSALGLFRSNIISGNVRLNWCMMDSQNSITILPSGHIGKCEHFLDSGFIGHVNTDVVNEELIKEYKEYYEDEEACETCALYPVCLRPKKCDVHKPCNPDHRRLLLYRATDAVFRTYDDFVSSHAK